VGLALFDGQVDTAENRLRPLIGLDADMKVADFEYSHD
jgi:hypothetical protein